MAIWRRDSDPAEYLQGVGFFEGFAPEELGRIVQLGREIELGMNARLIDQGSVGQVCYVVLEGSASVFIGGEYVATLSPGSMVGEMALLDHRPRRADVVANEPMRALAFDTKAFTSLLDEMPRARDRALQLLHDRQAANRALG